MSRIPIAMTLLASLSFSEPTHHITNLMNTIQTNHITQMTSNTTYRTMYSSLENLQQNNIQSLSSDEGTNLQRANENVQVYIADILIHELSEGAIDRRFTHTDYILCYPTKLQSLHTKLSNSTIWELQSTLESQTFKERDDLTFKYARYYMNLALLQMLDQEFRDSKVTHIQRYIEEYKEWITFAAPLWGENNIAIKAYAAIAMNEVLHDNSDAASKLYAIINRKFSDIDSYNCSGFGEGTGYLNFLFEELMPFYYLAKRCNLMDNSLFNPKVSASANWLLTIMDQSGYVPAVDDAIGSRNYWLAPFAYLNNNHTFLDHIEKGYSSKYAGTSQGLPLRFITYPTGEYREQYFHPSHVVFSGGVGKINYKASDNSHISLSIIAENNLLLSSGASHDQQDNLSITLNRATGMSVDKLITDIGYAGFGKEYDNSLNHYKANHYKNHNIGFPVSSSDVVNKNSYWTRDDLIELAQKLGTLNSVTGIFVGLIADLLQVDIGNTPKGAGGGQAYLKEKYASGLTVQMDYDGEYSGDYIQRTALNIADDIVILDRYSLHKATTIQHNLNQGKAESFQSLNSSRYTSSHNVTINKVANSNSQIRVSSFHENQQSLDYTSSDLNYKQNGSADLQVKRTINRSTANKTTPNLYSTITVLEPRNKNRTFGSAYIEVNGDNSMTMAITKDISNEVKRYIFVNNSQSQAYLTLNKGKIFETDAEFGYIDVNEQSNIIIDMNLYNVTEVSYKRRTLYQGPKEKEWKHHTPQIAPITLPLL